MASNPEKLPAVRVAPGCAVTSFRVSFTSGQISGLGGGPAGGQAGTMSSHRYAKRLGTLGDLIRERRTLAVYCRGDQCKAPGKLVDIAAVIREHGDMPLQRFAELSRCSVCGANEPQTVCAPTATGPVSRSS
jgi:hypothetical protein